MFGKLQARSRLSEIIHRELT